MKELFWKRVSQMDAKMLVLLMVLIKEELGRVGLGADLSNSGVYLEEAEGILQNYRILYDCSKKPYLKILIAFEHFIFNIQEKNWDWLVWQAEDILKTQYFDREYRAIQGSVPYGL
jgi:hypothetical protein